MTRPAVRILYLDHTAKLSGGEIAILNLTQALDKTQYEPVFVLGANGPLVDRLRHSGIETHVLELGSDIGETRKDSIGFGSLANIRQIFGLIGYILRLTQLIRSLKVEIVHTNSLKSDIYGVIAGRIAGKPVIWHIHDSIDENYLPAKVAKVFRILARFLPKYVIANSINTLTVLDMGRKDRVVVVYPGVDPNIFNEIPGPRLAKKQTVTMVGRIAPWKGQHIFLQAAAQVLKARPDVAFQIVGAPLFGEFEYEQTLHELATNLKIENQVSFLGFRDDVQDIVQNSDLIVHSSIIGEPFGQVVVEGMLAGKPVVATNGGALPEIVVDGTTGLLVEMGSVTGMAQAILRLISDPQMAQTMGEFGKQRAMGKFTVNSSVATIQSVYDQMLYGSKGGLLGNTTSLLERETI